MSTYTRALFAAAAGIALGASGAASAQFSNAFFFGDSLSDAGSYKPVLPPGTGLFTTNPGPVWVTPFANHYGLTASPANQGGNDYAQGGARVALLPGYPASAPTAAAVPVATQVSRFLAKGPVDRNAIYSVQGGANDITTQLTLLFLGQVTPGQAQANVDLAAAQLAQQVAALQAGGARYVMAWNMPDLGVTPDGRDSGIGTLITGVVQSFNAGFLAGLDAAGGKVARLDAFRLLNEVIGNPAAYGFADASSRACGTTAALVCTPADLVTPDAARSFVFADGGHPTTAFQAIEAQYAISVLSAPQQMAALAEAPLAIEQANWRTLDGRMVSSIGAPRSAGKWEAWAAYDYSAPDYSTSFFSGSGDVNTIAVGVDMKVSDRALIGVMFNYSENKADFGGASFKVTAPMGTLYTAYADGPWYVGASLGGAGLDYSTTRNITLGAATRTETGDTGGSQFVGRLAAGYWFTAGDWVHGPTLKLTYQDIKVDPFSENGSNSTSMTFGEQKRTSFVTSVGWQAAGKLGAIRPFARATWEYEGQADDREVSAAVKGMGGSFSVPATKPDNSWGLFNVGASAEFGKVTGYVTGSATAGKGDGDYYAVTVGIRVPL
jgi:outer membrane lipase/esterase